MPLSTSARVSGSSAAMWRYVKSTRPSRRRRVLGLDRLLDLEQQLGRLPDLVDAHDPRADRRVLVVREGAADAGAGLDEHVVALLDELERARGRQRDAVLVGLDLLGDADLHGAGTLPCEPLDEPPLLGAEVRRLARARVLGGALGPLRRGDDDVDALVGERPLEERLAPRSRHRTGGAARARPAAARARIAPPLPPSGRMTMTAMSSPRRERAGSAPRPRARAG